MLIARRAIIGRVPPVIVRIIAEIRKQIGGEFSAVSAVSNLIRVYSIQNNRYGNTQEAN